jgi:hypothetical protein
MPGQTNRNKCRGRRHSGHKLYTLKTNPAQFILFFDPLFPSSKVSVLGLHVTVIPPSFAPCYLFQRALQHLGGVERHRVSQQVILSIHNVADD